MVDIGRMKDLTVGERIPLAEVPDTFKGKLISAEERADNRGRQCLYVNIDVEGRTVTQKFTSMHLPDLIKALQSLGMTDTDGLKDKIVEWKVKVYRIGNPRHFPVRLV